MKAPNYGAIQQEIDDNYLDLRTGILDVYDFIGTIAEKYFYPVDITYGERTDDNPYCDLIFAMLEINGIELY